MSENEFWIQAKEAKIEFNANLLALKVCISQDEFETDELREENARNRIQTLLDSMSDYEVISICSVSEDTIANLINTHGLRFFGFDKGQGIPYRALLFTYANEVIIGGAEIRV